MPQIRLTAGEYGLEGRILLPAWENWHTKEDGRIRLDFGGDRVDGGQELTEGYQTALSYLFADQDAVKAAVLKGILSFLALQERALLGGETEDDPGLAGLPCPQTAEDLMGEIQLEEIHILPVEREGLCYIGYAFGCRWDQDGLGVMTHGRRVVEAGGRDTALLCWLAEDDLGHSH
ncbi:MAG: hypothetical protein HFK04_00405 [Oscillospiraceae bacterium]|nr:hypothetical protein [Oscillospiraceae bacterium]